MKPKTLTESLFKTVNHNDEVDFRLDLISHFDSKFFENDEYLFYNLMKYVQFGIPSKTQSIIVDKDKNIILYAPSLIEGFDNSLENWEYLYTAECLKILYKTYDIDRIIKQELGKCNDDVLAIASNVVITEALKTKFNKDIPDTAISAERLLQLTNIKYSYIKDTQYTLYKKLLEAYESDGNIKKIIEKTAKELENNIEGDTEVKDYEEVTPLNKRPVTDEELEEGTEEMLDYYNEAPLVSLDDFLKSTKDTLGGLFSKYIKDLQSISSHIRKDKFNIPVKIQQQNASNTMLEPLFNCINLIVQNKLISIINNYERTYSRINRKYPESEILKKGKIIKNEKVDLNISFYIDTSGSMSGCIKNLMKEVYSNTKTLKDRFIKSNKDKIKNLDFIFYEFNTKINRIKPGTIPPAEGGNVSLDKLIDYMKKHTDMSLINIIITDAGFKTINADIINQTSNIKNNIVVFTNDVSSWPDYKKLKTESKHRIEVIHTDKF